MKKTVFALLLGLLLGIKTTTSKLMHVVYLAIIAILWFKPAHFTWHLVTLHLAPVAFHLPNDDGYRTGTIIGLALISAVIVLIISLCANDSYHDYCHHK